MRGALVNLSLRPFRNDNLYRLLYASCVATLAAVSLSSLVIIGRSAWTLGAARHDLRAERAELVDLDGRDAALGRRLAAADSVVMQRRADFANAAILNRVFSWTQLFNELERVVPPDVKLRSVRPAVNARGRVDLQIDGTAKDYGAFVELEEALMGSTSFSRVYPGSERLEAPAYRPGAPPLVLPGTVPSAGPAGGAGGEFSFSLSCEYFPGGRPSEAPEAAPPGAGAPAGTPPTAAPGGAGR